MSTWQDAVRKGVADVISRMDEAELYELATDSYRNIRAARKALEKETE